MKYKLYAGFGVCAPSSVDQYSIGRWPETLRAIIVVARGPTGFKLLHTLFKFKAFDSKHGVSKGKNNT